MGLAAVETPVNKFLFDLALQGSNIASYAVSFAVAAFLLIAAHTAGKLTRQAWSEYRSRFYTANVVIASVILAISIGVVGILTIGRAEFAAAAAATGFEGLLSSVGDKVATSGGLLGALRQALADTSALVLVSVNVSSILVAFLLGYFAHDPDKHFDKAFERLRCSTRALERHDRRFKQASNRAREQARVRLDEINSLYTNATAAIVTQKTARRMALGEEERFALPELDRLLKGLRSQRHFTYEETATPDGAAPADVVENLINAGGNVTRVGLRDAK